MLAREDEPGDKQLVGYVVPRAVRPPRLMNSVNFCGREYLITWCRRSSYFWTSFALTHNGKIDRKALPAPSKRVRETSEVVPPQNPLEDAFSRLGNTSSDRAAFWALATGRGPVVPRQPKKRGGEVTGGDLDRAAEGREHKHP